MAGTRVLIVDACRVTSVSWRKALSGRGITVMAVHTLSTARAAVRTQRFNVVLLDTCLEEGLGIPFLDVVDELWPRPAVVLTPPSVDAQLAERYIGRCDAIVPKPIHDATLVSCISKVRMAEAVRTTPMPPGVVRFKLSKRQKELVRAAAAGMSDQETASRLHCERNTVSTQWQRLFEKAGCRTRAAVVALVSLWDPEKEPG